MANNRDPFLNPHNLLSEECINEEEFLNSLFVDDAVTIEETKNNQITTHALVEQALKENEKKPLTKRTFIDSISSTLAPMIGSMNEEEQKNFISQQYESLRKKPSKGKQNMVVFYQAHSPSNHEKWVSTPSSRKPQNNLRTFFKNLDPSKQPSDSKCLKYTSLNKKK